MVIYTNIPYDPTAGRNLGAGYNSFMDKLENDEWACFIDHDAMFTTKTWYAQLQQILLKNSEYSLLTAVTNRIGTPEQIVHGIDQNNHDIVYHRKVGENLQQKHYTEVIPVKDFCTSGVLMLIRKDTWCEYKFIDGFLRVDKTMCHTLLANGHKVGIMKGVYVYHWYRALGDLPEELMGRQ